MGFDLGGGVLSERAVPFARGSVTNDTGLIKWTRADGELAAHGTNPGSLPSPARCADMPEGESEPQSPRGLVADQPVHQGAQALPGREAERDWLEGSATMNQSSGISPTFIPTFAVMAPE